MQLSRLADIAVVLALASFMSIFPSSVFGDDKDDDERGKRHRPAGQPFAELQRQIDELKGRVATLEGSPIQVEFQVNCAAGDRVADALARAPKTLVPITITLHGLCTEAVVIVRPGVTLRGATAGSGLRAPSGTGNLLTLVGAHGLFLDQLTLMGGDNSLFATGGAFFNASRLHIEDSVANGILIANNAAGLLSNSTVKDSAQHGISAFSGGALSVTGTTVEGSTRFGINAAGGGQITLLFGTSVRHSGFMGAYAESGGSVAIQGATIEHSRNTGASAHPGGNILVRGATAVIENTQTGPGISAGGGAVWLQSGATVAHNAGGGVFAFGGGSVHITDDAIVEDNTGHGVNITGASSLLVATGAQIRRNTGDGIHLNDTSVVNLGANGQPLPQIVNNTGNGIACTGAVPAAQIAGGVATVTGNASPQITCPNPNP